MKTKIKQTLATILILVLTLSLLSACGTDSTHDTDPEKAILGKWYNDEGDCLEILSDHTYELHRVSEIRNSPGYDSGEWEFLFEENFFKFHTDSTYDTVLRIEIKKDARGEYIEYSAYGIFYKK